MDTSGRTSLCEDYVSFETAKLLKENGFNWSCLHYWQEEISEFCIQKGIFKWSNGEIPNMEISSPYRFSAPTLQMAMKWLRELHDIYIMIDKDFATENGWHYVVVRKHDWSDNIDKGLTQQESNSYTYEFACEAAIKYCLENLI